MKTVTVYDEKMVAAIVDGTKGQVKIDRRVVPGTGITIRDARRALVALHAAGYAVVRSRRLRRLEKLERT